MVFEKVNFNINKSESSINTFRKSDEIISRITIYFDFKSTLMLAVILIVVENKRAPGVGVHRSVYFYWCTYTE